jgi:hypothetical protein
MIADPVIDAQSSRCTRETATWSSKLNQQVNQNQAAPFLLERPQGLLCSVTGSFG